MESLFGPDEQLPVIPVDHPCRSCGHVESLHDNGKCERTGCTCGDVIGWRPTMPGDEPNREAADAGTVAAAQGNQDFLRACVEYIATIPAGTEFTADRVSWWAKKGELKATGCNVFGVVFRLAKSKGLIESTGRHVESKQASRKAGVIRVWVRV